MRKFIRFGDATASMCVKLWLGDARARRYSNLYGFGDARAKIHVNLYGLVM